jgi:hypothetical protein
MITLYLFNGARTKEAWNETSPEFIDDRKPEELEIVAEMVQVTYASRVTVMNGSDERFYDFDDNLLLVDGVYYGDFTVLSAD